MRALIKHGSYKPAAHELGIKLQTFKNAMSSSMHKLDCETGIMACVMYDRWWRQQPNEIEMVGDWLQRFRDACSDAHTGWYLWEHSSNFRGKEAHTKEWASCKNPTCQSRLKAAYGSS